ncbi:hypothetical protein A2U01_0113519, partial [Trifolium medium]|nr:hypothetical protein [Trifolium medium]
MKHKPPTFTGGYNPKGAVKWLEEVEIIFEAIGILYAERGSESLVEERQAEV